MTAFPYRRIVKGIGISDGGDELSPEALKERAVDGGNAVEAGGGVFKVIEGKAEGNEGMMSNRVGAEVVRGAASEGKDAEIFGTVEAVGVQLILGGGGKIIFAPKETGQQYARKGE